ncbi:MAG: lipoate--protein ligase, partial [Deltaproteobacteria bacterium]|nr:lipoate--protein ligase [Deltaproteobacteria bacterium]
AEKIRGKGVKSIRARVGNIADLLPDAPDVTVFMQRLQDAFGGVRRGFSAEEREAITRLAAKYASWEHN